MCIVDILFSSTQGRSTLLCEQMGRISSLYTAIYESIGIRGPLTGADVLIVASDESIIYSHCNEDGLVNSVKFQVCIAVHGTFEKRLEIT